MYNDLLTKYKANQITILGKPLTGGWVTLKSEGFHGDNLKYTDDEYYKNVPSDIAQKLKNNYYSIDIFIKI